MAFDTLPDTDDDTLIARFAAGDQSAARALTMRLAPGAFSLAMRMLRNEAEAEDVAQDAMLRLWKLAPNWEPGRAKASTWVYKVTANLCTDRLRRKQAAPLDGMPEPEDDAPSAATVIHTKERAEAVSRAMEHLPERQRIAVHLRHFEELANGEIAEILETSIDAVESLIARGKRALAEQLFKEKDRLGLM